MFEKTGSQSAKCTVCQKIYKLKRGSTSTLWRHAKQEHPAHLKDVTEKALFSQPTLKQVLEKEKEKYQKGSQRKNHLDDTLVTMIAQDLQPLSVVADAGFLKLCQALDRKYQVPSRMQVRNVLLPAKFNKVQDKVKKDIGLTSTVALTTDLWTSTNNSSFLAVTCHWWNQKKDKLDSSILDCHRVLGHHTATMIKEEVEKILEEFNIKEKVLTMVTDSGSNVVKAARDMDLRRIPCYAHSLNLVVTDSIKSVPDLQEARDKVSRVVKLTRQSTIAKEKLDQLQTSLNMTPKKLIQDVPTRWNALYDMLQRFLELKDAIVLLLAQPGMDKNTGPISSSVWEVIEDAVALLKPCYEATVELSGEKVATGSKIIPLTKVLLTHYTAATREANEGSTKKKLAHHLLANLNERFGGVEDIRILAMASLLDPR